MLCPQRLGVVHRNRTLVDLHPVSGRRYFHHLLLPVLVLLLLHLCILVDVLYDHIIVPKVRLIDGLILLLGIGLLKEDLHRHEGAVLLQHFTHFVLVGKLQAVLI